MRQATPLPPAPGRSSRALAYPRTRPRSVAARARGLAVLGELELAWRLIQNEFIAVTGTNGKTTTTEWIGHVHREAALPVAVAGNVGTALSSLVGRLAPDATIVCEVSSFQLEDTEAFAPEAAVLLNSRPTTSTAIRTFEDYVAAKLRVFANQGNDDIAVAPVDLGIEDIGGCARRVLFGARPGRGAVGARRLLWWDERAADRGRRDRAPRRPQPAERDGRRGGRLARGIDADAGCARACARSPASPTGSS